MNELDSLCDLPTVRHTAGPWFVEPKTFTDGTSALFVDSHPDHNDNHSVCELFGPDQQANAEFICRAVNSYYDMLKSLEEMERRVSNCIDEIRNLREELGEDWRRTTQDDAFDEGNRASIDRAKTAISKAKGGAK